MASSPWESLHWVGKLARNIKIFTSQTGNEKFYNYNFSKVKYSKKGEVIVLESGRTMTKV